MPVDSDRLNSDAAFAAEYFAAFGDVNAAHKQLSEDGAKVNLMEVTLTLAKGYQELKGVNTPEGDKEALDNEDTPGSQKEALELGISANERAAEEAENRRAEKEEEAERSPAPTPNQPTSSSGIDL